MAVNDKQNDKKGENILHMIQGKLLLLTSISNMVLFSWEEKYRFHVAVSWRMLHCDLMDQSFVTTSLKDLAVLLSWERKIRCFC